MYTYIVSGHYCYNIIEKVTFSKVPNKTYTPNFEFPKSRSPNTGIMYSNGHFRWSSFGDREERPKMVAPARNGYPAAAVVITEYVQVLKKVTDRKCIYVYNNTYVNKKNELFLIRE